MITYRAINKTNGRFYIGSTTDIERRKREHRKSRANTSFHIDYRKNPENFEWEVCEDQSHGRELEEALLEMFAGTDLCYNVSNRTDGGGGAKGHKWWRKLDGTQEVHCADCPGRDWVSGRLRSSTESARIATLGRIVSQETREKLSRKKKGQKRTEETKEKIGAGLRGKRWWVNPEGKTCREVERPGEGWVEGRVYREPEGVK
jgi:predicted GIY-YIG superfamily endonuclease